MRITLTPFVLAAALAVTSSAHADTFDFSYTGAGVTASGVLTTSGSVGGDYIVTGITGTRNGEMITGISTFDLADNLLSDTYPYVDFYGIAYTTADDSYDLYFSPYSNDLNVVVEEDGAYNDIAIAFDPVPVNTPEPSSLFLMGSGILAMAGLTRRKFRNA